MCLIYFVAQIEDLQAEVSAIVEKEPYMGEEIPLRWLRFEDSIQRASKRGTHYMNMDEVCVNKLFA